MPASISADLNARFAKIKLFLCDVDGILTDASVFIGKEHEVKRFYIRDGLGFIMLREEGIKAGWVSNRPSIATTKRAEEFEDRFSRTGQGAAKSPWWRTFWRGRGLSGRKSVIWATTSWTLGC